jgi:hypothetical protein
LGSTWALLGHPSGSTTTKNYGLSAIARCGGWALRQETRNGEGRHDRSSEGGRSCDALHELPPVERNTPQDLSLDAVFVHHPASFDEVPTR